MTQRESGVEQAARVLPLRLRSGVMSLPEDRRSQIEELRLRVGLPMAAVLPEGERALAGPPVTQQELEQLLELASRARYCMLTLFIQESASRHCSCS